ncbi:hypothetical protein KCU89_g56, partial [Aureobasidium melanogenum]
MGRNCLELIAAQLKSISGRGSRCASSQGAHRGPVSEPTARSFTLCRQKISKMRLLSSSQDQIRNSIQPSS